MRSTTSARRYRRKGTPLAADSVFSLVVSKYPSAPRAATALYKHGLFLQKAKRDREARQAFQTRHRQVPALR